MRNKVPLFTALVLGILASFKSAPGQTGPAGTEVPVEKEEAAAQLGSGFNTLTGVIQGTAIEFSQNDIERTPAGATVEHVRQLAESADEYYKILGLNAFAGAQGVGWNARAKVDLRQSMAYNDYSLHLIARTTVVDRLEKLAKYRLSATARQYLVDNGVAAFYKKYGDSFIIGIRRGGELFGTAELKTRSSKRKDQLATEIRAKALGAQGGLNLDRVASEVRAAREENVYFRTYGAGDFEVPKSVGEIEAAARRFPQVLAANPQRAGMISFTVVNYSLVEGVTEQLDVGRAAGILDRLAKQRIIALRQADNVAYVRKHPTQFPSIPPATLDSAADTATKTIRQIDEAFAKIVLDPFTPSDPSLADIVPFHGEPWVYREVRNVRKSMDAIGGYPRVHGDSDVNTQANATTEVMYSTKLLVDPAKIKVGMWLRVREHDGDHTTFQGGRDIDVFEAPAGYTIVRVLPTYDHEPTMLDPNAFHPKGKFDEALLDINVQGTYWDKLQLRIDSVMRDDGPWIGFKGDIRLQVEIEEQ